MSALDHPRRPSVVLTRRLPPVIEARMTELFHTTLSLDDAALGSDAMIAAMREADVLVPTLGDPIGAESIAAAGGRLKLIANFGVGVDHIDLAAARAHGIVVSNTPGVLTEDSADWAMALLLAAPRRLPEGERLLRAGKWEGWRPTALMGRRVNRKTLGIVGMGRIGQAIATRACGFGMTIRYHNRKRLPAVVESAVGATYEPELDALLAASDFVSLNCPLSSATRGMIDARRLALMKPDAFLINIARGELIDEAALADALEAGTIAGAGLDVFAHEPAVEPRLLALEQVMLLPHMASATHEGRAAMGERVIANIRAWTDGHRPPDQVLEGWV